MRNGGGVRPESFYFLYIRKVYPRLGRPLYPLTRVLSPLLHGTRLLLFVASVAGGHKLDHSWFGSEIRTSGEPPVVRPLRAHALHSSLFTLHFRT